MNQKPSFPMPDHELWCDDDLIAAFQLGTNNVLAVCFLSFGAEVEPQAVRARRVRQSSIVGGGVNNVLYLTDLSWTWFARQDIRKRAVEFIARARLECQAEKTVAFGNSAGGSGAILLNEDVHFDTVLATSAQMDLRLAFRAFDKRWKKWMPPQMRKFDFPDFSRGFAAGGTFTLLHGLRGPDAGHAALTPHAANIHHFLFPDLGHDMRARFQSNGLLGRIFESLTIGEMAQTEAMITESGGLRRGNLGYEASLYNWKAAGRGNSAKRQGLKEDD